MKVLVIGNGAREHALCWKLRQSPLLRSLYCASGNPGIAALADRVPLAVEEVQRLADFAADMKIDLTVVGPELPLTLGLADEFANRGLPVFGPSRRAAEIEGSKVFSKLFMDRHGIPTAPFAVVHDAGAALAEAARFGFPVVLKADGLAAGKGVLIAADAGLSSPKPSAPCSRSAVRHQRRPRAGRGLLAGEEVSFMALCDGERLLPLATSRDYKRIGDGDSGPNTGGMGAHSPSGGLSAETAAEVVETVMRPALAGLAAEGRPFVGVLYAGLMLTPEGPRVLEFNARFGDPEAQVLLMRLEDDLLPLLAVGRRRPFRRPPPLIPPRGGGLRRAGQPGLSRPAAPGRADPRPRPRRGGRGGRGLPRRHRDRGGRAGERRRPCALRLRPGPDLQGALERAYAAVGEVDWPGKVYRHDIGRRLLELDRTGVTGP